MTKEEKAEIKESLRKRRKSGGCSMWRNYLKEHPEAAKPDTSKPPSAEILPFHSYS